MPSEWRESTLGELCELNPDRLNSGWTHDPVEYIEISTVGVGQLLEPPVTVSRAAAPSRAQRLVRSGDTIVSSVRPNRRSFLYMRDPRPNTVVSTGFTVLRARANADPRFLYYLVTTQAFTDYLVSREEGAAYPAVTPEVFAEAPVSVPPLSVQRAVARILGALDDKIELNRKMSETLEQMARAIFKSWFIDFEPFRDKGMVDSPLGKIPKGWRVKALGSVADLNWGDTNTTKASYVPEGHTAYSAMGPDGFLPYFDYDRTGVVVSAIGANSGVTWLAPGKWSCIKNTIRFWATDPLVSTEYLYYATRGSEKWPLRGSAQPFISQGDARAMPVIVPAGTVAARFGELTRPLHRMVDANGVEARTLAAIRDALLPKLMSGEVRAEEAASSIERSP